MEYMFKKLANKPRVMEMQGIEPCTSRMQSERSTIWATSPYWLTNIFCHYWNRYWIKNSKQLFHNNRCMQTKQIIFITRKEQKRREKMKMNSELLRSRTNISFVLSNLGRQKVGKNVWQNSTTSYRNRSQKITQLLIVPHRKLNVSRYNTSLLVMPCCVSSYLQHLPNLISTGVFIKQTD